MQTCVRRATILWKDESRREGDVSSIDMGHAVSNKDWKIVG